MSWVPPQWRDYQVLKLTGRFPCELPDEVTAWDLDWQLAIDAKVAEVRGGDRG